MRSLKRLLIPLILFSFALRGRAAEPVSILFTAREDGRIENCRCPKDPYGALEKRLPEIQRLRDLGPVILLEAGNFFPETVDSLGAMFLLQAYALHEYDAVTLGWHELAYGAEWTRRISAELPVVSANLEFRDGSPVGEKARIVERGGETFAITGITTVETIRQLGPQFYESFTLLDPGAALASAFQNVPARAKRIILVQAPMDDIRANGDLWQGADLIIGGYNSDLINGSETVKGVPYVQVGAKSRYLGVAQFRGSRLKADLRPIQPQLPDDPRIVEIALNLRIERARNRPEEVHY